MAPPGHFHTMNKGIVVFEAVLRGLFLSQFTDLNVKKMQLKQTQANM